VELINYLNEHFFTQQELLDITKISEQTLVAYQNDGLMPMCSYKLNVTMQSDSFFGLHNESQTIEYYAKGYVSWLTVIESSTSPEAIYSLFEQRYKQAIEVLKQQGHSSDNPKISSALNDHIKEEWGHFINGIYGLCTQSGLPEDIAAKEFSIIEINELMALEEFNPQQIKKLTRAVDLLDNASSLFAPHERLRSSRHRLVDEVRRQHKLPH
jgi:hypothetical protein